MKAFDTDQIDKPSIFLIDLDAWKPVAVVNIAATGLKLKAFKLSN